MSALVIQTSIVAGDSCLSVELQSTVALTMASSDCGPLHLDYYDAKAGSTANFEQDTWPELLHSIVN